MAFVGALVDVPVATSARVAFFVLRFAANGGWVAIVSVGIEADWLGEDADSSRLVFDVRRSVHVSGKTFASECLGSGGTTSA